MAGNCEDVNDGFESYKQDTRIPCKYGVKCFQKNPTHHKKYKHPPKRRPDDHHGLQQNKRQKADKHNIVKQSQDEVAAHSSSDQPSGGENEKKEQQSTSSVEVETAHTPQARIIREDDSSEVDDKGSSSPCDVKEFIKQKFLVEMPEDFYEFWLFCEHLSNNKPQEALCPVGLTLVGPFDVLCGNLGPGSKYKKSEYLRHWRYYYDPPEFQTVIKGDEKKLFHIGYFRDDPKEAPCFVASNCAAVDCLIKPMAENLFGAVNSYLEEYRSKADPFQKMKVSRIQSSLQEWATNHKITLDLNTPQMKARSRKTVCKTFHQAGMVVPYDKKTELGYRSLIESERTLKKLLEKVVTATTDEERDAHLGKLQEIITAANIATDECDFGTGLELAVALFCFGGDVFHNTIRQLAGTAYGLLGREDFATILEAHLEDRRKGSDLSLLKK
ncbi:histone PARylation factor 1 [Schistocerca piceifrons]|uniref:histone PARylation factor 1 n=1 Tax=Schistocerca piceifrons TaxID=274613 RepID=UPI001F5E4121|nr:histone PARylation factor 1 [Schistocerca piceifrons]